MVSLTLLRCPLRQGIRTLLNRSPNLKIALEDTQKAVVRGMSGGHETRKLVVKPSRFEWERFKDEVHFFVFLGAAPLGLLAFTSNLIYGYSELADIPEGYEPEAWEYCRSPITRFMQKNIYTTLEKQYEKEMCILYKHWEQTKHPPKWRKVKELMYHRQDYKGWCWLPMDAHIYEKSAKAYKDFDEATGSRDY